MSEKLKGEGNLSGAERIRGYYPPQDFMRGFYFPVSDAEKEQYLKAYEGAKAKFNPNSIKGIPMIFGTGGDNKVGSWFKDAYLNPENVLEYQGREEFEESKIDKYFIASHECFLEQYDYKAIFRYGVNDESIRIAGELAKNKINSFIEKKYTDLRKKMIFDEHLRFNRLGVYLNMPMIESPYEPNYVVAE